MRYSVKMLAAPALMLVLAACGRDDSRADSALDDALRNDLALATTAQPYPAQQFVSPMEQGYAPQGVRQTTAGYSTGATTVRRAPATTTRRTTTTRRAPTSTGTSYPAPQAEPIRHTKRDAIIGATAGAVIGAATSRDRVKGGLIGAAVGGVAGAVIGHTIDVERPRY
jgi:hypothetical protein